MLTIEKLEEGIKEFGTPLYVFDLDEAERVLRELRKDTVGSARFCFAMKANPFLAGKMSALADRIEVCSAGEFEICGTLGIAPEKILISGVLKEERDLERILFSLRGQALYSVESPMQFLHFLRWGALHREKLRIFLRLTSGNQFGMDRETVRELVLETKKYPFLEIMGIHYFSGTRKKRPEIFREELAGLDRYLRELEAESGLALKELEYGPGIDVPCFEEQKDLREECISGLCRAIREMRWRGRVVLEMGRFLSATSGWYLTGVRDLKSGGGQNYCIVDGGIHQLSYDGQFLGMYRPHMTVSPKREGTGKKEWMVCGSLCTDKDILARGIALPELRIGDVMIFRNAGAYSMTEGMALFLSHALPKVALYQQAKGWRLVRGEQPTWIWNTEVPEANR